MDQIDRFVEALHNPPQDVIRILEKEQENKEFAWMDNYQIPEKNLRILRNASKTSQASR